MDGQGAAAFVPRMLLRRPSEAPRHWSVEGTMVLVDISGFTSLSEQLAKRGRVGTEDLIATLAEIFTALLSATDDGGDVVKFAGDALMLSYVGEDDARRACHAAAAMQRVLGEVGSVRLAGARARLRMSVGVHRGRWDLALTGTTAEYLLALGPAVDELLALQDAARAGQILLSPTVAAELPAGWLGKPHDLGVLLGRVPRGALPPLHDPVPPPAAEPAGGGSGLERFLPRPFQERPDLLDGDSDHRRAAMGFVLVQGWGDLDDGARRQEVDRLTGVVEQACSATGVTLLDTDVARDGYRYFLAAGAPTAVEDADRRLLQVLALTVQATGALTVRAGLTSGQVFAGPVGSPQRRTYSVMGDTTNLAARLTAKAPVGGVLVHAPVLRGGAGAVDPEPQPPLTVKGKKTPLDVVVVRRTSGLRARTSSAPPFVGREDEVASLARTLGGVSDSGGAVVEIVGEPGLGKTRLAREGIARSGFAVHEVTLDPYGAEVPFRALGAVLRSLLAPVSLTGPDGGDRLLDLLRARAPELLTWTPLLATALGVDVPETPEVDEIDPRFRLSRLADVVRDLVAALVDEPTVLLVDDAQWADAASAEVLGAAVSALGATPLAVVLTRRDDGTGLVARPGSHRVALTPLPEAAARRLVVGPVDAAGGQAPLPLHPQRVQEILGQADGNPYFLLELAGSGVEELPGSVEQLVAMRLDALPRTDRALVREAAVLGSTFPATLLTQTTGSTLDDLGAAAAELLDVDGGTVRFRRQVYREVAYEQLTFRRRTAAHAAAAAALERLPAAAGDALLPMLSLHHHAAGQWQRAFECSWEAAGAARDRYANEEAAVFCRRAVESGRRSSLGPDALRPVRAVLAEVLTLAGHHEEAVAAHRQSMRGAPEDEQVIALYRIGMLRREQERHPAALRAASDVRRRAARVAAPTGAELSAEADLLAAGVRLYQGRMPLALRLCARAMQTAQDLPEGDERTRILARAYALHDTVVVQHEGRPGDYDELPVQMFESLGDLYNQGRFALNVAIGRFYAGRWDEALRMYRTSLELAQRTGDVLSVALAELNIGELLAYQGRASEAVALLEQSLATLVALRRPLTAGHAALFLGAARLVAGDLTGAGAAFAECRRHFAEVPPPSYSADDLATWEHELARHLGDAAEVLEGAEAALARPTAWAPPHHARLLRVRGLLLVARGSLAEADEVFAGALEVTADEPLPYESGLTLAACGDRTAAESVLRPLGVDVELLRVVVDPV